MPGTRCCIAACQNTLEKTRHTNKSISYHRFPKNRAIRKLWIEKCNRNGKWNPNSCRICSKHFYNDDIIGNCRTEMSNAPPRRKLNQKAVPVLFLEDVKKLFSKNIMTSLPFQQIYNHIKLDVQNIVPRNDSLYYEDIKNDESLELRDIKEENICLDLVNIKSEDLNNMSESDIESNETSTSEDSVKANAKSSSFNVCNLMKEAATVAHELRARKRNVKKLEREIKILELKLQRVISLISTSLKLSHRYLLCKRRKGTVRQALCS